MESFKFNTIFSHYNILKTFRGFFFFKLILFLSIVLISFSAFNFPKSLHIKVTKHINKTFEVDNFQLSEIIISNRINDDVPIKIKENFYKITHQNKVLGFAFIDRANSKTSYFEYLVLFNTELEIINIKVLTYREEHGNEIGSKRWLKQFIGLTKNSRVQLQKNIDGISGATISVKSMTYSVDKLLQTIAILEKNNTFDLQ